MILNLKEITDPSFSENTKTFGVSWIKDSTVDIGKVIVYSQDKAIPKQFKLKNWIKSTFVRGAGSEDTELFYITYTFK